MANILMIIAPERFRDEELFVSKDFLEEKGHKIRIASKIVGECYGSRGGSIKSELYLSDVKTEDYNAIVFIGGGGSKIYFNDLEAISIAKNAYDQGKIVAAICLAPVILANAGILKGKNATVVGTESKTIIEKGAYYTGPGVTSDSRIVTGNAPKATLLFAQKINDLLNK